MKSSSIMNEGSISVSPVLQPGEQKINSTVSVTFEISD